MLDGMNGSLDGLVLGEVELVVQVARRDAQACVNTRALGALQRLGSHIDVLVNGACKAADGAVFASNETNLVNGLEIARAGDGEAGLNDVDVHANELTRNDELLLGVHAGAGALLTITERSVEDVNLTGHDAS